MFFDESYRKPVYIKKNIMKTERTEDVLSLLRDGSSGWRRILQ